MESLKVCSTLMQACYVAAQDALAELAELGYITGDPLASSRRADKFALNGTSGRGKKRNGKNNARASR